MDRLKTVFRTLLCVVVLIPMLLAVQPVQALDIYYRWAFAPAVTCSTPGPGVRALFASQPVEWLNVPAGATYNIVYITNGVETLTGPFALTPGTSSFTYAGLVMNGPSYPLSVGVRLETLVGGNIVYTSTMSTTCVANGGTTSSVVNGVPASSGFAGPALPANHNLVGFVKDTPVYNMPGGLATNDTIRTCQTAFVLETSADGKWGRIFVMGGWIPLAATVDVSEDYGQASAPAHLPGC
jgi:hypothetical protein